MGKYRVMIVEDDFRVADINKSVVEEVEMFQVVKIAKTASDALKYFNEEVPDLLVVDIYLPDFNGIELIRRIRKNDYPVDIILITAAHDPDTIENSMRYGVFDYIITPFDFSRFRQALENYHKYRQEIKSSGEYDQEKINKIISHNVIARSGGKRDLPKGITGFTMEKVRSGISDCLSSFAIEDVIERTRLSKITVRRYLEYMADTGVLEKTYRHRKKGRPTVIYTRKK